MLTDAFGRFAHGMIRTLSGAALSKGLISSKDIAIRKQFCATINSLLHFLKFTPIVVLMNMGESKYLHFSKVYLGCTLSQLNHMSAKKDETEAEG